MSLSKKYPNENQTELYDRVTKIQTKVIDRITYLKKNKKNYECRHILKLPEHCQQYDSSINYYDKFWKTFLINELTYKRVQDMEVYLKDYDKKLEEIEELFQKHQELTGDRGKKKNRRIADQIEKSHECPYPKCFKIYGSDVSLNLHMKLKHNGGNKTDRQKAAQLIWQARQKGKPIPQFYINLPPNFVHQYGIMTNRIKKQSY